MHIIKEKRFYINLLTITIPIALQNLISFATSMMDTIMLGRADDTGVFLSASCLQISRFSFYRLSVLAWRGHQRYLVRNIGENVILRQYGRFIRLY